MVKQCFFWLLEVCTCTKIRLKSLYIRKILSTKYVYYAKFVYITCYFRLCTIFVQKMSLYIVQRSLKNLCTSLKISADNQKKHCRPLPSAQPASIQTGFFLYIVKFRNSAQIFLPVHTRLIIFLGGAKRKFTECFVVWCGATQ